MDFVVGGGDGGGTMDVCLVMYGPSESWPRAMDTPVLAADVHRYAKQWQYC